MRGDLNHRTVALPTPFRRRSAHETFRPQATRCPSAHCGSALLSHSSPEQLNAPTCCSTGDTAPSQRHPNRISLPKLNWRRKPRCCRRTIKSALTSARLGFHGKMEKRAHCMSPDLYFMHLRTLFWPITDHVVITSTFETIVDVRNVSIQ